MIAANPWLRLSLNALRLGTEANTVVALRMMKIAGGGAGAATEAQLMVSEKIQAAIEAQSQLAVGVSVRRARAAPRHNSLRSSASARKNSNSTRRTADGSNKTPKISGTTRSGPFSLC